MAAWLAAALARPPHPSNATPTARPPALPLPSSALSPVIKTFRDGDSVPERTRYMRYAIRSPRYGVELGGNASVYILVSFAFAVVCPLVTLLGAALCAGERVAACRGLRRAAPCEHTAMCSGRPQPHVRWAHPVPCYAAPRLSHPAICSCARLPPLLTLRSLVTPSLPLPNARRVAVLAVAAHLRLPTQGGCPAQCHALRWCTHGKGVKHGTQEAGSSPPQCEPPSQHSALQPSPRQYESGGLWFPFVAERIQLSAAVMVVFTGGRWRCAGGRVATHSPPRQVLFAHGCTKALTLVNSAMHDRRSQPPPSLVHPQ